MSNIKMVKQWVAEDGSVHATKQAAEQNELRMRATELVAKGGDPDYVVQSLVDAGLLSLKVKQARKPRAPKAVAATPAPAPAKANGAKKAAA